MSDEEKARFKEATAYIYDKYADMFPEGLVDSIKETK